MLSTQEELSRLRMEARTLRINNSLMIRSWQSQKNRVDKLQEEVKKKKQRIEQLETENQKLKKEIEKIKRQRDTYKGMIFKPNQVKEETMEKLFGEKKSRGGQIGHKGYGRKNPNRISKTFRIFFHHCPYCQKSVLRGNKTKSHTVTDIPAPAETAAETYRYESERQWCRNCKREILAVPGAVIAHCRLGLNLIVQILIWKYRGKQTLVQIKDDLFLIYGVRISVGGIQEILHRGRRYLGKDYQNLLKKIRGSPVRHADETGHRINGVNGWLWEFVTKNAVYYTIEETRGKAVPESVLGEIKENSVLVHDDYISYQSLPGLHQSCWAHLLRESRKETEQPFASNEVKNLHEQLKIIFSRLSQAVSNPEYGTSQRLKLHQQFLEEVNDISSQDFLADDAKRVQNRIKNQGRNLLTAVLYDDVPLTNNLAERNIRPMVIARKISGGSRSHHGAETLAVNSSIIQTIRLRNQPIYPTLRQMILQGAIGKD